MKTVVMLVLMLFGTIDMFAQTNFYTETKFLMHWKVA